MGSPWRMLDWSKRYALPPGTARAGGTPFAQHASFRVGGSMTQTVGDFLLQRLCQWGVKRIYGYPGDGINGIMGALGRNPDMEFIQARHEELAAFMACAHAKFSGEIGV